MGNRNNAIYFVVAIFAVLLSVISVSQAVNYSKASEARAVLSLVSEWKPELAEKLAESSTDNICGLAIPGVYCDSHGRVAKISLVGQNLRGSIPAIIGDLTHLIALDLSGNNIYGSIPESLARLPRLRELNLEGNPISGPLPAFVGAFPVLVKLNIRATGLNACPSPTWIQSVSQCCISEASTACSSSFTHCAGACNADKVEFTRAVHRADAPTGGAKLNTREIAGIAVGAVIAAVIIGVIIFFIVTETGRKTEDEQQMEMPRRFGQPDSSLTTNSREGSLPDRSKPPLPANISSSTSSSSSDSSSSTSSSSSRSEEDFPAPPKAKRKSLPADQVIEENAEEQKSPAVDAKSSHDALLKPRRKKRRKPKVTAASADE